MTYFAKVSNGIVEEVIRADQDFIDTGLVGDPSNWLETSYNTRGNVLYLPNSNTPDPDQSAKLRGNYAGTGYTYDLANDVFYAPMPTEGDWVLDTNTWLWVEVL
jgi:hypothetical protein